MNYHSDAWIMNEVVDHWNELLTYFDLNQVIGVFYQGSGNYGLDYENSDVDTKAILLPSFRDIALNKKPVSTTHVRANDSHTDWKDCRLYFSTFKKQNLNFLEILFTPYEILNPTYADFWKELVNNREAIAHYNPYKAVKSMKGIAMEKYHAMEHEYPAKVEVLATYGYDPKQLHHLLRVEDYIARYIAGEFYEDCLHPTDCEYLLEVKKGKYDLENARRVADLALAHVIEMAEDFCAKAEDKGNPEVDELLDDVMYRMMKVCVQEELKDGT